MPQGQRHKPPVTGVVLNWKSWDHWSDLQKPCRYCGGLTNLRDSKRKPAHKVCAEEAIARQIAEQAESYENERRRQRDVQQELPDADQG
ncbi:hypothetical protein PV341_16140 [Streptomyces sp. PA03-1a]|nr:hypothetical protein [Streptomyces sp. PA03-1a]MDX2813351.1 hypothetical protein [Streptomyces sp. PA03-5A]